MEERGVLTMNALEKINAEVEELRNHRFAAVLVAVAAIIIAAMAVRDSQLEFKRANVYREIALEAMRSIPDPELVDPIMLAIAQADDTN
jgi:hypothetical protein